MKKMRQKDISWISPKRNTHQKNDAEEGLHETTQKRKRNSMKKLTELEKYINIKI